MNQNENQKSKKIILPFMNSNIPDRPANKTSNREYGSTKSNQMSSERVYKDGSRGSKQGQPRIQSSAQSQIQSMLDAGGQRHQGIVVSVRGEFGFVKPCELPDEVYFRVRDIMSIDGGDQDVQIKEGEEVAFFVIKESSKGKMSDRAILLERLAKGSVQLEIKIASRASATVVKLPIRVGSKEEPGFAVLTTPLTSDNASNLSPGRSEICRVELWQRCLPDGFSCRVGDLISLDVQRYRPENLVFARNVLLTQPFSLFREIGRIRSIKTEQGFGFVRSMHRTFDIYFRLNDILDGTKLEQGDCVEFDVEPDEMRNRGGSTNEPVRLKAIRLQVLKSSQELKHLSDFLVFRKFSLAPLSKDLTGEMTKCQERNDRVDPYKTLGYIQLESVDELPQVTLPPEIILAMRCLASAQDVKEIVSSCATNYHFELCKKLCSDECQEFGYESVSSAESSEGAGFRVRLWRLTPQEIEVKQNKSDAKNQNKKSSSPVRVPFSSAELHCDQVLNTFPLLSLNGLPVHFDLYYDSIEGRFAALNVRVTSVAGPESRCIVISTSHIDSELRLCLLRLVPSQGAAFALVSTLEAVKFPVGSVVVARTALWAGCALIASHLVLAPTDMTEQSDITHPKACLGLVVESGQIVFVAQKAELDSCYWNVMGLRTRSVDGTESSTIQNNKDKDKDKEKKGKKKSDETIPHAFEWLPHFIASIASTDGKPVFSQQLSVFNESTLEKLASKLLLPPNCREVIPIVEPLTSQLTSPKIGDFVLFSAVAASSSGLNDVPIETACTPAILQGISSRQLRGIVVKIESNASSAATSALAALHLAHKVRHRLCEIRVADSETLAASPAVALASAMQLPSSSCYYCDSSEVRISHSDGGESATSADISHNLAVKVGDIVEFFAVDVEVPFWSESITGLAIYPAVVPRSVTIGSIVAGVSPNHIYFSFYWNAKILNIFM